MKVMTIRFWCDSLESAHALAQATNPRKRRRIWSSIRVLLEKAYVWQMKNRLALEIVLLSVVVCVGCSGSNSDSKSTPTATGIR